MAISIIDWNNKLHHAVSDDKVGIRIATLLESQDRGTYITVIPPGAFVKPHYHSKGDEEYHIISGVGIIKLLPVNSLHKDSQTICKHVKAQNSFLIPSNVIHQLINNGSEPLVLIFSCPISHLKEDRFIVENIEEKLNGDA